MVKNLTIVWSDDVDHHYIRELCIIRKSMEAMKKQNRAFEEGKDGGSEEIKALEEEATGLREKFKQMESEVEVKTKEASTAEANAVALKKQLEGFLLEYHRLLVDNQNLRTQLQYDDFVKSMEDLDSSAKEDGGFMASHLKQIEQ